MILYQTLKDKNNPEEVVSKGPFKCTRSDAWLGHGFYFWDSHIELAHWWGLGSFKENNYIICECKIEYGDDLWDLVGKGEHRNEFRDCCIDFNKLYSHRKVTVPNVITYLLRFKIINYTGIRVYPENSASSRFFDRFMFKKLKFINGHIAKLDLIPPIQVCLFEKKTLNLHDYCIVYPEYYAELQEFA